MAIFKNGILGGFSGKVGTVVGYTLGDQEVMRSLPDRKAPATPGELRNREAFGLVQDTLSAIKPFIQAGCHGWFTKTGGMRGANAYNRKYSLTEESGALAIDPVRFRVTGGDLPGAVAPSFALEDPMTMRFNWDTAVQEGADPMDQVMLLVIDLDARKASYCNIGAFRSTGTEIVGLRQEFLHRVVHAYVGFVAKDRSRQSDSQYLGSVVVA